MFKSLFGNDEGQNEEMEELEESLRSGKFKILSVQAVYNTDEEEYYTAATCINEQNKIESISIEDFEISMDVTDLAGAYIDYEEYEEDGEIFYKGKIYK